MNFTMITFSASCKTLRILAAKMLTNQLIGVVDEPEAPRATMLETRETAHQREKQSRRRLSLYESKRFDESRVSRLNTRDASPLSVFVEIVRYAACCCAGGMQIGSLINVSLYFYARKQASRRDWTRGASSRRPRSTARCSSCGRACSCSSAARTTTNSSERRPSSVATGPGPRTRPSASTSANWPSCEPVSEIQRASLSWHR